MQRYTKLAIIGLIIPSFFIIYGNRIAGFITVYSYFYTITIKNLNITTYSNQAFALSFWDPFVLLNPGGLLALPANMFANPVYTNSAFTGIFLEGLSGKFFLLSLVVFVVGVIINHFVGESTNSKFITNELETIVDNPYSRIIMFVTLFFTFLFQLISFILTPVENSNISTNVTIPLGIVLIFYALTQVLSDLGDNYEFIGKIILSFVIVLNLFILIVNLAIGYRGNLYLKIGFFIFLTACQLLLFKDIQHVQKLKENNEILAGSLLTFTVSPITRLFGIGATAAESENLLVSRARAFRSRNEWYFTNPLAKFIYLVIGLLIFYILFSVSFSIGILSLVVLILLVLILINFINVNKYNYEGRLKSILNLTMIISVLFIQDLFILFLRFKVPITVF